MKKLILFIVGIMASLNSMAGSDIKLKAGSTSFLGETASAVVQMDFSSARWEEDEDFKTWCGEDYEVRVKTAVDNFIDAFNVNSKGLKIVKEQASAKYVMAFTIKNLERHQSFSGTWGQGKVSVTATLDIINAQTNEKVCTLFIDGYGSGKDYTTTDAIGKCFKGLGKQLAKQK